MALFGKKAQDAPSAPPADDMASTGGPATLVAEPAGDLNGKTKVKIARAPKAPKSRAVRSGVAVGLNIGNQFIKAVEVTSKGGELAVTAMGMVPTPPESYSNGNVLSVSALSNAIRDLWRTAGIKSKVVVTSVAGTGALVVRVIEVPKMSDGELKANMQVDADRYIPFPPSEVVMDFKALRELPSDPDAPNMDVLLAAAQREVIDLHVNVVQRARLSPRAIDVEPIAAVRALGLERQGGPGFADYNEVTAVVNIGATGAEISILRGDVLVFTRAVPNGGNAVTQAIADGMGLPFFDAERVKIDSADALAPAGYNAAANDFGFGSGGDDFDFGAPSAAGIDDFGAAPGAAKTDDPFDLDFFNQGGQEEPGAGHAQKEGGIPDDSPFSFDFDAPPPAVPAPAAPPTPLTSSDAPAPGSAFDFGFDDEPAAPIVSPVVSAPDLDEPAADAPAADAPAAPISFGFDDPAPASLDKGTQTLSDEPVAILPEDDFASSAPPVVTSAPVASAFDFDNFDLPAVQPGAPTSPVASAPAAADPFSFDAPPAPLAAPAPPFPDPILAATTGAAASQFDLDDIFGAPAASPVAATPVAATPVAAAVDSMPAATMAEDFGLGTPAATPAVVTPATTSSASAGNDFDLSGIDTGVGDDFGASFDTPGDNFVAFGAGLAPDGGLTDAATLYGLIYAPLEELSNEVRRSLEFHLGRYPDATISRLVLMGGGAKLKNLDAFLTQMLGVPTSIANPFAHITMRAAKLPPEYATENGPVCTVALGLALRDFVD